MPLQLETGSSSNSSSRIVAKDKDQDATVDEMNSIGSGLSHSKDLPEKLVSGQLVDNLAARNMHSSSTSAGRLKSALRNHTLLCKTRMTTGAAQTKVLPSSMSPLLPFCYPPSSAVPSAPKNRLCRLLPSTVPHFTSPRANTNVRR